MTARKPVSIGTGMPASLNLAAFGQSLQAAFGAVAYQVGSSVVGKTWRDVDVRIMLPDDRFDALFPGYAVGNQNDAWWGLICASVSELGRVRTGLPIDFQIQRTTDANARYDGPRQPLLTFWAEDAGQPEKRDT